MNNNNINIADILRDCPKGTKLYSPIFGQGVFEEVQEYNDGSNIDIRCNDMIYEFDELGRYGKDGECLLFPSKDMRDWSKFKPQSEYPFKPFDRVVARSGERDYWYAEIFSHFVKDISDEYVCIGGAYDTCLPYNDRTARLIGTKDPYTEKGGAE